MKEQVYNSNELSPNPKVNNLNLEDKENETKSGSLNNEVLSQEEEKMRQMKTAMEKERTKIEEEKTQLAEKQRIISEKELELREKELNAIAGFEKENEKIRTIFDQKIEELKLKITEEERKLNDLKNKEFDLISAEIRERRNLMFQDLEKDFSEKQGLLKLLLKKQQQEFDSLNSQKENNIQKRMLELNEKEQKCVEWSSSLSEKEMELKFKEMEINNTKKMLDEDRNNIKSEINERVRESLSNNGRKIQSQERIIEELNENLVHLENKIYKYEEINKKFGHKTPEEIYLEIKEKDQKIGELNRELLKRPSIDTLAENERLKKENSELYEKNRELLKENGILKTDQTNWLVSVSELENQKNLKEIAEHQTDALKAQMEKYSLEINKLRSLYEQPKEIEARIGVINEPYFEVKPLNHNTDIDELQWLNNIHNLCIDSGLRFNKRLLYAFHTALKTSEWSPITVLAGVSGTGKSELPRLYSRFGGLYYLPLPVQPDWDSPQSLFGFFNSIDNRFNATPLLRTLVQSQNDKEEDKGISNHLLLVLLDEMNLAHVELYFSELLSKLETRRGDVKGVNIEIDLGAGLDKYRINLGRNILWTGTMNEDETTKSLSDKVLDRGNLISFPRPKTFERRLKLELANESKMLSRKVWDSWLCSKINFTDELDKYKTSLEEINSYLEEVGRALGHRVWQSIENYMANHPLLIAAQRDAEDTNGMKFEKYMKIAFEDALVHKVMPKLRGIEVEGSSKEKCLIPIGNKINEIASGLYEDYQLAITSSQGVFVWRSAKYLENGDVE